ncbi:hypothetical protein KEM55_006405 [Ascosphaera atra]|nr:hypothetical protein KEM55_006405 [Ascosphaera atra]
MSYEVYTHEYVGVINHIALYIETTPGSDSQPASGLKYHVVGTILQGMTYQREDTPDPVTVPTYIPDTKKRIGSIAIEDMKRFEGECCEVVPPPASQVFLNGKRKDPSKPLYRCGQWLRDVIDLAFEKGIFSD